MQPGNGMLRHQNRMSWTAALIVFLLLVPISSSLQGFKTWHPVDSRFAADDSPLGSASAPVHAPVLMKQHDANMDSRASGHEAATPVAAIGVTVPSGDSRFYSCAGPLRPISATPRVSRGRAPPISSSL